MTSLCSHTIYYPYLLFPNNNSLPQGPVARRVAHDEKKISQKEKIKNCAGEGPEGHSCRPGNRAVQCRLVLQRLRMLELGFVQQGLKKVSMISKEEGTGETCKYEEEREKERKERPSDAPLYRSLELW